VYEKPAEKSKEPEQAGKLADGAKAGSAAEQKKVGQYKKGRNPCLFCLLCKCLEASAAVAVAIAAAAKDE
jgi:hypothetical protein